jgi:lipid-binding SYLF domain-containing protein
MLRTNALRFGTVVVGTLLAAPAFAAGNGINPSRTVNPANTNATVGSAKTGSSTNTDTNKKGARQLVNEATAEVNKMSADSQLTKLLAKAKGVYLVPEFGRGALVIGGRGGAGVVLAKKNGKWTDPAFYDLGGISIGAQAGGSGGEIAFLLMSQGAVDAFKSGNKFSLNAGAGLSIVNYSANSQASWGKGDIILWSSTKGAYAGATVSVTDVNWADGNNKAYYGRKVDPSKILAGDVTAPDAAKLKAALRG